MEGVPQAEFVSLKALYKELRGCVAVGAVACGGQVTGAPFPGLTVKKHGAMSLPLKDEEAEKLCTVLRPSPFGKGGKEILDVSFRNSFEADLDEFELANPNWARFVKEVILPKVVEQMGFEGAACLRRFTSCSSIARDPSASRTRTRKRESECLARSSLCCPPNFPDVLSL